MHGFGLQYRTLIVLSVLLALITNGCASTTAMSGHTMPTSMSATLTPLPTHFPAFTDQRAAYLAADGYLHAVTLDGKTDVTGPDLIGFGSQNAELTSAGVSLDGHFVAYDSGSDPLVVYDLRAQTPPSVALHQGRLYIPLSMFWSLDSQQLAIGRDDYTAGGTYLVTITPSLPSKLPDNPPVPNTSTLTQSDAQKDAQGWIDNHTLLMSTYSTAQDGTEMGIVQALDSMTGATRTISTFPHRELSNRLFALSPDGQEVLQYNFPAHAQPFTPEAELIDTATGTIHPLPNLVALQQQHGTWISSIAWRPGTHNFAATIGFGDQQGVQVSDYLINADTDTATAFQASDYVEQWTADGNTLILSNAAINQNGTTEGPNTLTAVTFSTSGQVTLKVLTKQSMSFAFLGFVRSA